MLAGCSWAEGEVEEVENTIAGTLSRRLGTAVANVGVGSYSLLQTVRRVAAEAEAAQPRLLVIPYGSWLVDRCIKLNALADLVYRPVFRRRASDGQLVVVEPAQLEPAVFAEACDLLQRRRPTQRQHVELDLIKFYLRVRNGFASNWLYRLAGRRRYDIPDLRRMNERRAVLEHCLAALGETASRLKFKVLIVQMWRFDANQERERQDAVLLADLTASMTDFIHVDYRAVAERWRQHLAELGKTEAEFRLPLWAADHNHPNGTGYTLVGDVISDEIKKRGLI